MKKYNNDKDMIKICSMMHSITKLDTRFIKKENKTLFQSINYSVPLLLEHTNNDFIHILEQLRILSQYNYYYYINSYGLEYIACGLWKNEAYHGCIIIGPFISSLSIIDLTKDIILKNNLPIGERKTLEQFYQSLPVLTESEYNHIGDLLVTLCGNPLKPSQRISSRSEKLVLKENHLHINIEEEKQIIEDRYEQQNKLMDAISRGDKNEVIQLVEDALLILEFSDRIPGSPLRSSKNIAFVSNTLYRVAAEKGGVHPVYLHNISERFAILIERTTSLPQLQKLAVLMANEYCDLVRTYSTGQYSKIVKKAIDYILLHLGHSLTLQQIADEIHVNASYLSRKFKEETGSTVSEYINHKRIDEAKLYLQRGNISITDVAFTVGFNDLNYFSKVFKKVTSLTPTEFAKRKIHK